jgi:hypothetical protein
MTQYKFQLEYSDSQEDALVDPNYYRIKGTCRKCVSLDGDCLKLVPSGGNPYVEFVLDTEARTLTANGSEIGFKEDMNLRVNLPSQFVAWDAQNNQIALYFSGGYLEYSCLVVSDYLQASGIGATWFNVIGAQIPDSPK